MERAMGIEPTPNPLFTGFPGMYLIVSRRRREKRRAYPTAKHLAVQIQAGVSPPATYH